jgi:hypothetical protein
MSNEINLIHNYKRSLITLLSIPIILIGCIYISYGELFDSIIMQHHSPLKFYQLHVHLAVFNGEFFQVPLKPLPQVTASIGYYSVITIYILFFAWLVLFATSSYLQLTQQTGSKNSIIVELSMILTIYILLISPELNLWLSLIGYIIIAVVLVMLSLYWIYEIKTKR